TPADGDAFLTSAMTWTLPGLSRAARKSRTGGASDKRRSRSRSGTRARASAISCPLAATILSRMVLTWCGPHSTRRTQQAVGYYQGPSSDSLGYRSESLSLMESPEAILRQLWFFGGLTLGSGLLAFGLWLYHRRQPLFPPQRYRAVPWNGLELILLLFLVFVAIRPLVQAILDRSGFFTWLYGAEIRMPDVAEGPGKADPLPLARVGIWSAAFATPLQILCIPVLLRVSSGTRPYQLGLTTHRWRRNVILGVLGWLLLSPVVHTVNLLVNYA